CNTRIHHANLSYPQMRNWAWVAKSYGAASEEANLLPKMMRWVEKRRVHSEHNESGFPQLPTWERTSICEAQERTSDTQSYSANGLHTSRAHSMKRCASGLMVRFFNVRMPDRRAAPRT